MRIFFIFLLCPIATFASEDPKELCIINGLAETHHFTVALDNGGRASADLPNGGALCIQGSGSGTIAVFKNSTDVEGCSRRSEANLATKVTEFPDIDLCSWHKG